MASNQNPGIVDPYSPDTSGIVDPYQNQEPAQPEQGSGPGLIGGAMREVADVGRSVASGVNTFGVQIPGDIYGVITGDYDNPLSEYGRAGAEYWRDRQSDVLKEDQQALQQYIDEGEGFWSKAGRTFWGTMKNPRLLTNTLAEQVPGIVMTGGAGRVVGGAAQRVVTKRLAEEAARKGVSREVLERAAQRYGNRAAIGAGTAGAVGAGAAMHGSESGASSYEELMALPDELWQENPDFQALINDGLSTADAKQALSERYARNAALSAGAVSILTARIPGARTIEKKLVGGTGPGASRIRNAILGAVGEGTQEATEESTGQMFSNWAVSRVDPDQDLMEGAGQAFGQGAAFAPMGAGFGAMRPTGLIDRARNATGDIFDAPDVDSAIDAFEQDMDMELAPEGSPLGGDGQGPGAGGAGQQVSAEQAINAYWDYVDAYGDQQVDADSVAGQQLQQIVSNLQAAGIDPMTQPVPERGTVVDFDESAGAYDFEIVPMDTGRRQEDQIPMAQQDIDTGDLSLFDEQQAQQDSRSIDFEPVSPIDTSGLQLERREDLDRREENLVDWDETAVPDMTLAPRDRPEPGSMIPAVPGRPEQIQGVGRFNEATQQWELPEQEGEQAASEQQKQRRDTLQKEIDAIKRQGNTDELATFIAKNGGISMEEAKRQGAMDLNQRAPGTIRWIFTKNGRTFDEWAEKLQEEGYLPPDEPYSANDVVRMLTESVNKQAKHYSPLGQELQALVNFQEEEGIQQMMQDDGEFSLEAYDEDSIESFEESAELNEQQKFVAGLVDEALEVGVPEQRVRQILTESDIFDAAGFTGMTEIVDEIDQARARAKSRPGDPAGQTPAAERNQEATGQPGIPAAGRETIAGQEDGQGAIGAEAGDPRRQRLSEIRQLQDDARAERDLDTSYELSQEATNLATEIATETLDRGEPIMFRSDDLYHVIAPSAQRPGKIQLTTYNDTGALSDTQYDSVAKAVDDGLRPVRDRIVDSAEAEQIMQRLGAAEAEYQSRRAEAEQAMSSAAVDQAANQAATSEQNTLPEPSPEQLEAGNYQKGHLTLHGMDVSIEIPRGAKRRGTDAQGNAWEREASAHYGYIRRTTGADGEQVDVYVGPNPAAQTVYVVDQINSDGSFDEHKAMIGFNSREEAVKAYRANYPKGFKVGPVTETSIEEFQAFVEQGDNYPFIEWARDNELGGYEQKALDNFEKQQPDTDPERFEAEEDWDYQVTDKYFPEPNNPRNATKQAGEEISQAEADRIVQSWEAEADRIGREFDNSNKVIISLFDASGEIAAPWVRAGFDVRQYDLKLGDDLLMNLPTADLIEMQEEGKEVVGVLAQPPCTCFSSSGARWWKERHDKDDRAMVNKMFGPKASVYFSKPKEYTRALVAATEAVIDLSDNGNLKFWAVENPVGRIAKEMGLPTPVLRFQPHVYGDPYTKQTQLWGKFNNDLPTANVEPTEGSLMHKMWSNAEKDGGLRSLTPKGFSYSFFMANVDEAMAGRPRAEQDQQSYSDQQSRLPDGYTLKQQDVGPLKGGWRVVGPDNFMGGIRNRQSEAIDNALDTISTQNAFSREAEIERQAKETVADKIRAGEKPTRGEWKAAGLADDYQLDRGYVYQPDVSQFLVEYFGVPKNNIRNNIGRASGTVRNDMGNERPIVYLGRLHEVFGSSDQNTDSSVFEGYEQYSSSPSMPVSEPSQFDMFVHNNASKEQKRESLANTYGTIIKSRPVDYLPSAIDTIYSREDLAHLTAPLRREAQEVFLATVTDERGKVLRVIRHTRGLKDASQVSPIEVVAEVASIEGASRVHFTHNHPSGSEIPSTPDKSITVKLHNMLDGTGIEPGYHVIVAGTKWVGVPSDPSMIPVEDARDGQGTIRAGARRKQIPVTERKVTRRVTMGEAITSSAIAERSLRKQGDSILLLNTQHEPVGIVPMPADEMSQLREGGRVNRILSAINTTNADAAIIKVNTSGAQPDPETMRTANNVARFLSRTGSGIRVLDAVVEDGTGHMTSFSASGTLQSNGPFFSRGDGSGISLNRQQIGNILRPITEQLPGAPGVTVVQNMQSSDVPEAVRAEDQRQKRQGATGEPEGFYYRGRVYIVLDGLQRKEGETDEQALIRVFAHEVLGHAGLRGLFGNQLKEVLQEVRRRRGPDVARKARQYGLNMQNDTDAMVAAEEMLATLAQTEPENSLVTQAVEAIRKALRNLYMRLPKSARDALGGTSFARWINRMTDAQIIERFLVPARRSMQQPAGNAQPDGVPAFQRAFHGTPHRFDRFSLDAIGTGEGAQAYGWGLYFAGKREIADFYREHLSQGVVSNMRPSQQTNVREWWSEAEERFPDNPSKQAAWHFLNQMESKKQALEYFDNLPERAFTDGGAHKYYDESRSFTRDQLEEYADEFYSEGAIYQVDIPESTELLDWDADFINQPEKVRQALMAHKEEIEDLLDESGYAGDLYEYSGGELYQIIKRMGEREMLPALPEEEVRALDADERASLYLNTLGIPGLRYLDASSRGDFYEIENPSPSLGSTKWIVRDGRDDVVAARLDSKAQAEKWIADQKSHNYVIWDEDVVTVEAVNDEKIQAEQQENESRGEVPGQVALDDFETGEPVTFQYAHNTESATRMFGIPTNESPYGRYFEPSGKYVVETSVTSDRPEMEYGTLSFENPLVIDNDNLGWKKSLSDHFGGKRGKELSKAIIDAGYDGVVTVDVRNGNPRNTSEILDLTSFDESQAMFARDTSTGDLDLEGQTDEQIRAQERDRQRTAREDAEAARQAEQREQADRERDDFTLTGSDSEADQAAARGQLPLFSRAGEKNLFVAHNLSVENLEHVIELGGLAAPSLAVGRTEYGFNDFGEVTLLAPSSIIESPKARTFDADVYTPRHPRALYDLNERAFRAQVQAIENEHGLETPDLQSLESDGAEAMANSPAYQYAWLKSQGRAPKAKRMKVDPAVRKIARLGINRYEMLNDDRVRKIAENHYRKVQKQVVEALGEDAPRANIYFEDDGSLKYNFLRELTGKAARYNEHGGVDVYQLRSDLSKRLRPTTTRQKYEKWVKAKFNSLVEGQRMFDGFTASGNRRYKPYTLESVVKYMTKRVQGGENFNYGAGSLRASYANELRRVSQVQRNRDRIVSNEDMDAIREQSNARLLEALDELRPHYKFAADGWMYLNDASEAIAEGPSGWREAFDLNEESRQIITDLIDYLRDLPTGYFETKIGRVVDLSEFSVAIVPKGTPKEITDALREKGVKVKRYDRRDDESRREQIINQEEVLFSRSSADTGPLGLYSQLSRFVRDASLPQWKGGKAAKGKDVWQNLQSAAKKGQVKNEEMKWTGIEEFLTADPDARFTREQVLDYLDSNGVNLKEVVGSEAAGNEAEIEWQSPEVWDDPEAWQPDVDSILFDFDEGMEDGPIGDIESWMNGWINDHPEVVVDNYYGSLSEDQQNTLDSLEDNVAAVEWLLKNTDANPQQEMRSLARDDFEVYASRIAEQRYKEDPIRIIHADNMDLAIFGNEDVGYTLRTDPFRHDTTVAGPEYSLSEIEISAQEYAVESGMIAGEDDPNVARWEDYVTEGDYENYREIKITLPDIEGDFYENAHFADRNVLSFLRVTDRELETGEEIAAPVDEIVDRIEVRFHDVPETVVRRVAEVFDADNNAVVWRAGIGRLSEEKTDAEIEQEIRQNLKKPREFSSTPYYVDQEGNLRRRSRQEQPEKRTYFIDEFQSDWHQKGRQYGYATGQTPDNSAVIQAEDAVSEAMGSLRSSRTLIGIASKDSADAAADYIEFKFSDEELVEKLKPLAVDYYNAVKKYEAELKRERVGPPDVPFKENAWMSLGLKRAIIQAVEGGYEAFAWADGDVIKERWSDRYATMYDMQYDKKMPSIVKKVTGIKPRHVEEIGEPGYWVIPITDKLREQVTGSGLPMFIRSQANTAPRVTSTMSVTINGEQRTRVRYSDGSEDIVDGPPPSSPDSGTFSWGNRKAGKAPASQWEAENQRIREKDRPLWESAKKILRRQFAPGGLLPEKVFDEKITRDSQFGAVEFDVRHLVGELDRAIQADYGVTADNLSENDQEALSQALAGNVPANMKRRSKRVVVAMRQYIDNLSAQYRGILMEQAEELVRQAEQSGDNQAMAQAKQRLQLTEIIASNEGRYVHRSYQAFDDAGWFKRVPEKALNDARRYLIGRYRESGDSASESRRKAEVVMHEILKNGTAYEGMEAFVRESKLGAKDLSVLQKRKQIAPEIRALLGEYKDPRLNFAKTSTKMGRLIWNQRFLDRVREVGMGSFLFEGLDRPPEATVQISAEGNESYAPLNGLWTTPEVDQAFRDALGREQMEDWYRTIVQVNGAVKFGKTILSPTTAARNWQSALFFTLANGHFDLTQMRKSVSGLKEYFTHSGRGEQLEYLRRLQELGVVYDTPYAGEMMRLLDDTQIENFISGHVGVMKARKALMAAQRFYQYGDDFWKIIGFENEKNLLMKHAGMSQAEAEREAAERVRNTYPTYSMVGRGIQSLRRFPLAGTFVSFPAEIIRTSVNMVRYVAKDMKNPKMRPMAKRRAAGLAIASGFAYALQEMSKAMFDVDDDDEEAVRIQAAPWQRNSNLIFTGRDEDGDMRYIDISFLDPYNIWKRPITAILRDQPWQDSATQVAGEVLSPFLGEDILFGAIREIVSNKRSSGGEIYKETDSPDRQLLAIGDHLRKAVQPGLASNLERTWKALRGETSPSGRQYDIWDEGLSWVGWRVSTLDPKVALYYRSFEFGDAKSDASRTLTQVLTDPNRVDADDIERAFERSLKMRSQAYEQMHKLVSSAQRSGLEDVEVFRILRASGVSQVDSRALLRGEIPPWAPTRQSEANAFRRADTLLGREKARQIRDRYRTARRNRPVQ